MNVIDELQHFPHAARAVFAFADLIAGVAIEGARRPVSGPKLSGLSFVQGPLFDRLVERDIENLGGDFVVPYDE